MVGAAVAFSDISLRLDAERKLRALEERWRLTLDHAPIGIAIGVVVAEPDIPTSAVLAAADAAMYAYKRAHLR